MTSNFSQLFWPLYYAPFVGALVILFIGIFISKEKFESKKLWFKAMFFIFEFLFVIIIPFIGITTTQDKCSEHPFDLNGMLTPYMCWLIPALGYYGSRYLKKQLPPLFIFILSSSVVFGFFYCVVVVIHFIPFLVGVVFPLFGAEIISPLVCAFLLVKELNSYRKFYSRYIEENKETLKGGGLNSFFSRVLASDFIKRNSAVAGLLLPFVVILQGLLFLFGQNPASLVTQFTESCGFLLSNYQSCSCGDDYLCSIAAFGDPKLVQPRRYGVRNKKIILTTRQLLITNAFESWLEDHTPRIHKIIRRIYNGMNIPADRLAKKKYVANILYIVMKPAEWFCLAWLYLFDKDPETRIGKQYLPPDELKKFELQNKPVK